MDEHISDFLAKIPKDGSLFDIQPLFFSFTNDSSTHFLFGESLARSKNATGRSDAAEFGVGDEAPLIERDIAVVTDELAKVVEGDEKVSHAVEKHSLWFISFSSTPILSPEQASV